ncbi:DUF2474 domain-containing protein [Photorhabdus noenieputensis]|uniref:DUF2474 domain-containing protein n=1 Tax=Photorhabdus noenieputensis TaxID=1208607 RepID=UPI001BD63861|nr:DUF2474 domain-containing protein [Photorhabdus noenieputensis]MBS9437591.1 DUF2474 domain-containing protein [Photorhabdus noenieputensis]MCK3670661.1 DUF2474 domain-containing protein [Photorhabdus noenieputensis]
MNKVTTNQSTPRPSVWKRIGWMAMIWLCSVMALFAVSTLFRLLMTAAGMKLK